MVGQEVPSAYLQDGGKHLWSATTFYLRPEPHLWGPKNLRPDPPIVSAWMGGEPGRGALPSIITQKNLNSSQPAPIRPMGEALLSWVEIVVWEGAGDLAESVGDGAEARGAQPVADARQGRIRLRGHLTVNGEAPTSTCGSPPRTVVKIQDSVSQFPLCGQPCVTNYHLVVGFGNRLSYMPNLQ